MLTESATIKIKIDDVERDIRVTPLFLHSEKEPWEPNEIFELQETGNNNGGQYEDFTEPTELGKIIVDDQKEWRYEGDGDMNESVLQQIAEFVLNYEEGQ
jgi:hypothetical protein